MSITEKFKLLPAPLWVLEVEKSTMVLVLQLQANIASLNL